jgi:outer membrane protein assembly factor BamA
MKKLVIIVFACLCIPALGQAQNEQPQNEQPQNEQFQNEPPQNQEPIDISIDYGDPKEYEIADITVSGARFLDSNALISMSGLRVGDKIEVPGTAISSAIKKLWEQGILGDVRVAATRIDGDKIYLDIYP